MDACRHEPLHLFCFHTGIDDDGSRKKMFGQKPIVPLSFGFCSKAAQQIQKTVDLVGGITKVILISLKFKSTPAFGRNQVRVLLVEWAKDRALGVLACHSEHVSKPGGGTTAQPESEEFDGRKWDHIHFLLVI